MPIQSSIGTFPSKVTQHPFAEVIHEAAAALSDRMIKPHVMKEETLQTTDQLQPELLLDRPEKASQQLEAALEVGDVFQMGGSKAQER
jgi:hypothetical protein